MTQNATNRNNYINEGWKRTFANNLFKMSRQYMQGMLSNGKICFNVIIMRTDDELLCDLSKTNETVM